MTRTATGSSTLPPPARVPPAFHALALLWVAGMLALARAAPLTYEGLLQEDRFIEWWTVGLFGAAAYYRLRAALGVRAVFDGLVGLFCLFVAGEEFSWGQRLLGFTPPDAFLEHNAQQEFTLHNFKALFGQPRQVLILALGGYALLSLLARSGAGRTALRRTGATPPPLPAAAWFAAAGALLLWYPADYTGEWVEVLAGGLFLVTAPRVRRGAAVPAGAAALLAVVLTLVSGSGRGADPARIACTAREVEALARDLERGAATAELLRYGTVHKRLYTAGREGFVDAAALAEFEATPCADPARRRRARGIDPWGTAYWIETEWVEAGERYLTVYSMGPNRRRDRSDGLPAGDDIAASVLLSF